MFQWFHKLRIAQKLTLISVFFMIPDSIMLYLFITSINENIHVAQYEQTGNAYQRSLEPLLQLIPEHCLATRSGSDVTPAELAFLRARIDTAFAVLAKTDSRIGTELEFTPEGLAKRNRLGCDVDTVRGLWRMLCNSATSLSEEQREQKHVELIARVRSMISHAGDSSNLILDPELDSYYLMDTTLLALPQTQDRLAQIMVDGLARLHADGRAEDERTALAIDLEFLRHDDIDRVNSSTQVALNNGNPDYGPNPRFQERIPPLLKKYTDASNRFASMVEALRSSKTPGFSESDFLAAGQMARLTSFDLWHASEEELNGLLQRRIDYYTYRRTRSLAVAAGAVLMAFMLVTFITRSISGPLKKQAAELKKVNDALSVAHAKLETRVVASDAELLRAEEKYRGIFENSVMGIFQTTPQGQYISANSALARLYGYASPQELMAGVTDIAKSLYFLPDRRREFLAAIAMTGSVTNFESEIWHRDGSVRWINENAREMRDSAGNLLCFEGTVEDITERKMAEIEQARAKHSSEDARKAAEAARAAAEAASTAKSDFLAGMSHEIRTPLNGVIGMVDMLSNTPLNPQQQRYAKVIKTSSDALLTIINQILDFSKIEAGKLELESHPFDIYFAVEDVVSVLAQKASAKGLELACRIDPAIPAQVIGDGDRVRQVLMNLLNNAIKFTSTGEVVVNVAPADNANAPADSLTLKVSVSDTGIGIPADRLDRLFKSFSQVDSSITRQFGGTGLGLAISKQLAELMGGSIGVQSIVGKGSTFWFTVVLKPDDTVQQTLSFKGHRVLVVDDSTTQCQLMCEQLSAWQIDAVHATGAPAAIDLMQSSARQGKPFGATIVDLNMPGMDGHAMAQVVSTLPALRGMPMILMSGLDKSSELDGKLFLRCLTKPVRQSQLMDALMHALVAARLPAPATTAGGEESAFAPSASAATSGPRILLAEDIDINQFVVTETLARGNYTCDIANNGREAVAAAAKVRYDLILMDCQMPEMSGFEAATAIRAAEKAAGVSPVPIVALTANAVKGDRERCLAAGMDEYLTKPLNPEKLLETIRTCAGAAPVKAPVEVVKPQLAEAPVGDGAAFDQAALLARCDGDSAMVESLLRKFQERSHTLWEQLLTGYNAKDTAQTTRLAHAIKGTAANLSANAVADIAARLEELGREDNLSAAEELVQKLGAELQHCRDTFEQVLASRAKMPMDAAGV